jgi:hypothetical protein
VERSVEEAFAILGVTSDCTRRQLRRRYVALAHRFHPDRMNTKDSIRRATVRMAEINAAYRVAREHLRGHGNPTRPTRPAAQRGSMGSAGAGYVRSWSIWEHERGTHEWRGQRAAHGLAIAAAVAATAVVLASVLPSSWTAYIWLSAAIAAGIATVVLLRQRAE